MDKSKICNPLFNKQQPNTENKIQKSKVDTTNKHSKTSLSKKQIAELPKYTGITAKEVTSTNIYIFSLKS